MWKSEGPIPSKVGGAEKIRAPDGHRNGSVRVEIHLNSASEARARVRETGGGARTGASGPSSSFWAGGGAGDQELAAARARAGPIGASS